MLRVSVCQCQCCVCVPLCPVSVLPLRGRASEALRISSAASVFDMEEQILVTKFDMEVTKCVRQWLCGSARPCACKSALGGVRAWAPAGGECVRVAAGSRRHRHPRRHPAARAGEWVRG